MLRLKATHARRTKADDAKTRKALQGDFVPEDLHSYRLDRHTFTIYVGGDPHDEGDSDETRGVEPGVTHHMADRFEMNLGILSGINPDQPILINLSSCGGLWEEGMKMFAAILTCPNPVTVLATKWARSMTSLVPLAADRFLIRPPATYMLHHGSYGFAGLNQEAATDDLERRRSTEMMMRLYVARLQEQGKHHAKRPTEIRRILDEEVRRHIDVWFTADEAARWGFSDGVFTGDYRNLRAPKKNLERRKAMLGVLRRPISVEIKVS